MIKHKKNYYFILKLLIFCLPFFAILSSFFIFDPFKIIYKYRGRDYFKDYHIALNRDYISTEIFLANRSTVKYDSYIFGNSRSLAFLTKEWQKYVSNISPFHFDASAESLYGISKKIQFIDEMNDFLKTALVVVDRDVVAKEVKNDNDYLYIKHPAVSGENRLFFYYVFLKSYFTNNFYIKYLYAKSFNKFDNYPDYFEKPKMQFIDVTNDWYFQVPEETISSNSTAYYYQYKNVFFKRADHEIQGKKLIDEDRLELLKKIKAIFKKHKTNYKIVIGPLYDQIKLNREDLKSLELIFGKENVYDFSGKNKYTQDVTNYYENNHFRHSVASKILEEIYAHQSPEQ